MESARSPLIEKLHEDRTDMARYREWKRGEDRRMLEAIEAKGEVVADLLAAYDARHAALVRFMESGRCRDASTARGSCPPLRR
ncbi:hypothetical protein C1878_03115 [Gordonibacter sp. 28C]|uniref:hypothetical protein n=1 Tax=Gordonibacter sp. 28C TaxID=2078569 RepID=UPI000E175CEB|nr:hypothetical protein [Gordonibacter sp. 28C]RDB63802.1 hypothetical protein C1878_03115 [Gordonibacter sp. 28C]